LFVTGFTATESGVDPANSVLAYVAPAITVTLSLPEFAT